MPRGIGDVMREITTNIIMTTSLEITNIIMITKEKMEDIKDRDLDIMIQIEGMKKLSELRLSEKQSLKVKCLKIKMI